MWADVSQEKKVKSKTKIVLLNAMQGLTLAPVRDEWSASHPHHVSPPGRGPPSTHWIEGCVGLRAGLATGSRGNILWLWP
jgi:hypothetical protein